jgi:pectate lyase
VKCIFFAASVVAFSLMEAGAGPVGYGREATGGAGGPVRTAHTPGEFRALAESTGDQRLTIQVHGRLDVGNVSVGSNKTIEGAGRSPTLVGGLMIHRGVRNVIIRNLNITNPTRKKHMEGRDGISITGGRVVWVDHCTFKDCSDGSLDISNGADDVTVSWCKFEYSSKKQPHRFVMLANGPPKKSVKKKLHLTLHNNWFAKHSYSRMPAATKARVHMFNNYFDPGENSYATNARKDTEILAEANFYRETKNPFYKEKNAKLSSTGNIFEKCSGKIDPGRDKVFDPPYSYEPVKASKVPDIVQAGAGCRF